MATRRRRSAVKAPLSKYACARAIAASRLIGISGSLSFRGEVEDREPGIYNPRSVVVDSGLAAARRPGMTGSLAPALEPLASADYRRCDTAHRLRMRQGEKRGKRVVKIL